MDFLFHERAKAFFCHRSTRVVTFQLLRLGNSAILVNNRHVLRGDKGELVLPHFDDISSEFAESKHVGAEEVLPFTESDHQRR